MLSLLWKIKTEFYFFREKGQTPWKICARFSVLQSQDLVSFRKKNLFSKKSVIQNCILFPADSIKGFESRIQLGNLTSFKLQLWECIEKKMMMNIMMMMMMMMRSLTLGWPRCRIRQGRGLRDTPSENWYRQGGGRWPGEYRVVQWSNYWLYWLIN